MARKLLKFVFLSLLSCSAVLAADLDPAKELQAQSIFDNVMSPFCPGRLLEDCPSSQASELREKIRTDLSSGKDPEEIIDTLVATYGEEMRAAPQAKGFGIWAWIAPFLFLGFGFILVLVWLKRQIGKESAKTPDKVDTRMQSKIESELADL